MKKSYHSTVVPTTVAKTTRRRSRGLAMVPVGVNPGGGVSLMEDSFVDVDVCVGGDHPERAGLRRIIYDFRYNARTASLSRSVQQLPHPCPQRRPVAAGDEGPRHPHRIAEEVVLV